MTVLLTILIAFYVLFEGSLFFACLVTNIKYKPLFLHIFSALKDKFLPNIVRKHEGWIEESKQTINRFRENLAGFIAENKLLKMNLDHTLSRIEKGEYKLQGAAIEMKKRFDTNEGYIDKLKEQLRVAQSKVFQAENDLTQLSLRKQSSQIQKDLISSIKNLQNNSPLANLDKLRREVEKDEILVEVLEELEVELTSATDGKVLMLENNCNNDEAFRKCFPQEVETSISAD